MSGQVFIQPPAHLPFRNHLDEVDDPLSDFTDNEVKIMNREFINDEKLRTAGHNDL